MCKPYVSLAMDYGMMMVNWFLRNGFFFFLGFFPRTFTTHRIAGEGGGYLFISTTSTRLTDTSHQLGEYYREFTSAYS